MKKRAFFLILPLSALFFLTCQFTEPKAIEIKGSPQIRFAETVDIGKIFTDLLDDAINVNEDMSIIPCKNTPDITYLIHANLLNESFDAVENISEIDNLKEHFPNMTINSSHIGNILLNDEVLIYNTDDLLIVPLKEVGSRLKGFTFSEQKIKLYFSGSSALINKALLRMSIYEMVPDEHGDEHPEILDEKDGLDVDSYHSDIDTWKADGYYDGLSCPDPEHGIEIDVPITGNDIAIAFTVYFPAGETLSMSDFEAGDINVETVIWLPFVFEADEHDGADLEFPKDSFFSSEDDLFGRGEAGDENQFTNIVESLSVDIKFLNNPFMGADFVIESKGIEIHNLIQNNALSFTLTEDHIIKINNPDNWPFTPNLKISFPPGHKLHFPRVFNATEFSFKVKMRYRIDLE